MFLNKIRKIFKKKSKKEEKYQVTFCQSPPKIYSNAKNFEVKNDDDGKNESMFDESIAVAATPAPTPTPTTNQFALSRHRSQTSKFTKSILRTSNFKKNHGIQKKVRFHHSHKKNSFRKPIFSRSRYQKSTSSLSNKNYFEIAKALVESGNQRKVFIFGQSGNEQWKAVKHVFESVTYLELHDDHYEIGWIEDNTHFSFDLKDAKTKHYSKFLMNCIGESVQKLCFNCSADNPLYKLILEKIVGNEHMITFSVGPDCDKEYGIEIVKMFSKRIKNFEVTSHLIDGNVGKALDVYFTLFLFYSKMTKLM